MQSLYWWLRVPNITPSPNADSPTPLFYSNSRLQQLILPLKITDPSTLTTTSSLLKTNSYLYGRFTELVLDRTTHEYGTRHGINVGRNVLKVVNLLNIVVMLYIVLLRYCIFSSTSGRFVVLSVSVYAYSFSSLQAHRQKIGLNKFSLIVQEV